MGLRLGVGADGCKVATRIEYSGLKGDPTHVSVDVELLLAWLSKYQEWQQLSWGALLEEDRLT